LLQIPQLVILIFPNRSHTLLKLTLKA